MFEGGGVAGGEFGLGLGPLGCERGIRDGLSLE